MIIGETLHISDLTFENVDITTDGGVSVVSVLAPMAEEVVEEEEEGLEQEEPEIIGRGQDDEEEAEEEAE